MRPSRTREKTYLKPICTKDKKVHRKKPFLELPLRSCSSNHRFIGFAHEILVFDILGMLPKEQTEIRGNKANKKEVIYRHCNFATTQGKNIEAAPPVGDSKRVLRDEKSTACTDNLSNESQG